MGGTDFSDYAAGTTANFWNATNGAYYSSAKSYVPEIPWNDSCGGQVIGNYFGFSTGYGAYGTCNAMFQWLNTEGGSGGPSGCATGSPTLPSAVSGTCAGYAKPSWQAIPGNPADGVRDLPDVSLFAAAGLWGHYYVFCFDYCPGDITTWAGGGGTSFSSPIMAGIQAVINQALGTNNVGNPNAVYYQIGQNQYASSVSTSACNSSTGPSAGCSFNDVTQGDIVVPCGGTLNCYSDGGGLGLLSTSSTSFAPDYPATPGWDFATGIGTVNAFNLVQSFMSSVSPASAPAAPQLVLPADGAISIPVQATLSWNVSAGVAAYDVYFGASSPPPLAASTASLNYATGTLNPGATYYWAIGARNSLGANISPVQSFTVGCINTLTLTSAIAPSSGGTGTIPVTAPAGCAWTAVSNAAWITIVSGSSGSGDGSVVYSVAVDTGVQRSGTIMVGGQAFTVAQSYPLISTLAGGNMPATGAPGASVSIPVSYGLAVDASGNTYFSSPSLNAVFKADPTGMVARVAGTGAVGSSGDGGPALSARLNSPNGVAVDAAGNVYIADTNNYRIRKVDTFGNIATWAGTGFCCTSSGDGGPATSARIGRAYGMTVDASANLYFADSYNNVIRKVDASGIISTVAGTGSYGYSGDGGRAASAQLYTPMGVAVDASGNLYIADRSNYRIRMVSTSGIITTVAGNGKCCYSGDGGPATSAELEPSGVALDATGNLYLTDWGGARIRVVSTSGFISTVAGTGALGFSGDGGPATRSNVDSPAGITTDNSGNIYIADVGNARIRVVSGGIMNTLVGGATGDGGLGVFGSFNQPFGIARDSAGNTYIADTYNNRVRKVTVSGAIMTVAGSGMAGFSGDGGPATGANLYRPMAVAVDAADNVYIGDEYNYRVRKVDSSGKITTVAGTGTSGNTGDGGTATNARIGAVYGLTFDAAGNLYIADASNSVIRKVDASGFITTVAGSGTSGGFSGDGGLATNARLSSPEGMAIDSSGNLYIADRGNNRIRMVSRYGVITTVAGTGGCCFGGDGGPATKAIIQPIGVGLDSIGNLYISDANGRVRLVTANGVITTLAGTGLLGYSGDGVPAVSAAIPSVIGIAVDGNGMVAFTDGSGNAVRVLTSAGIQPLLTIQSTHAGAFTPGSTGTYTVTVSNATPAAATTGTVKVTETLPRRVDAGRHVRSRLELRLECLCPRRCLGRWIEFPADRRDGECGHKNSIPADEPRLGIGRRRERSRNGGSDADCIAQPARHHQNP